MMKAHEANKCMIRHAPTTRSNHSHGSHSRSSTSLSSNGSLDCREDDGDEFHDDDDGIAELDRDGDRLPLISEEHPPSHPPALRVTGGGGSGTTAWQRRVLAVIAIVVALGLWIDDWNPQRTDSLTSETSKGVNRTAANESVVDFEPTSTTPPLLSPSNPPEDDRVNASFLALHSLPHLHCPRVPPRPMSATDAQHYTEWYEKESSRLITTDVDEYLRVFRETDYDNWGHTYQQVKRGMYSWKAKHFAGLLRRKNTSGNVARKVAAPKTLYESACGIGLNLFMTLEILREWSSRSSSPYSSSVDHIVVYGNEYQADSTKLARTIASQDVFPGRLGGICQSDSTNLSHVPSDSFDLVYTGYITPLADPLGLAESLQLRSDDDLYGRYTEYCESDNATSAALRLKAQHLQEVWYASWVGEMIRIAKPGAKILIEQVSYPLCEAYYDWGGVSQHSWVRALGTYQWPIDPKSLEYQDDIIFRHRYHLAMRKLPRS